MPEPATPTAGLLAGGIRALTGGLRALIRRFRADHSSLWQAQLGAHFQPTAMIHHYLYVAVAPNRRALAAADDRAVERAQAFLERTLGDQLPERPVMFDGNSVLFAEPDARGNRWRALSVHRTGLVELLWGLQLNEDESGSLNLPAEEVVARLLDVAEAVASPEYRQLSTLRRPWRRAGRVDWRMSVATHVSGEHGPIGWKAIDLPVASPPRAAHERAFVAPEGFGVRSMRSRRRGARAEATAELLLRELLTANGYYSLGDTVERTVAAVQARTSR